VQPGYGPYSAAKAGLIALTKTLALENAPLVRANAVAPGAVDTAFLSGGTGRAAAPLRLDPTAHAAAIPMRRIATADDVSLPILFLCGPGAAYMTGQVLWINGGGHMP
jgi:NAD(P)-dependent dehydrogenase (short-subunit alcohol dehydrogenase family)